MITTPTRRRFIASAAAAAMLAQARPAAADAPPETTSLRLAKIPGICIAPAYVAEELLHAEGFTDVRYIAAEAGVVECADAGRSANSTSRSISSLPTCP